jgi:hypothetical protein
MILVTGATRYRWGGSVLFLGSGFRRAIGKVCSLAGLALTEMSDVESNVRPITESRLRSGDQGVAEGGARVKHAAASASGRDESAVPQHG